MTQHADNEQHDTDNGQPASAPDEPQRPLGPWQIVSSTLAAAFGVQSSRNRERDFSQGKASHFIIAGVVFTVAFVLVMALIVNLVLGALTG